MLSRQCYDASSDLIQICGFVLLGLGSIQSVLWDIILSFEMLKTLLFTAKQHIMTINVPILPWQVMWLVYNFIHFSALVCFENTIKPQPDKVAVISAILNLHVHLDNEMQRRSQWWPSLDVLWCLVAGLLWPSQESFVPIWTFRLLGGKLSVVCFMTPFFMPLTWHK